jgi:hypothetical protein
MKKLLAYVVITTSMLLPSHVLADHHGYTLRVASLDGSLTISTIVDDFTDPVLNKMQCLRDATILYESFLEQGVAEKYEITCKPTEEYTL